MTTTTDERASRSRDKPSGRTRPVPRVSSDQLLTQGAEVVIDHHGVEYRLRRTRADKLILTK